MIAHLQIVHSAPEFFAHSGHAAVERGEGFGCFCAECDRELSAPFGFEGRLIWCLYCGMEKGYVVAIENPFGHHRWTFGVSREEAAEEREWIKGGPDHFEKMAEARARKIGHVINLFG
ncbi:hypothetical protein C7441_110105 [Pseudaminobacter salicylatoxidans]|uniref:Uncharacterized protein n=1 Tax=Pseudaminobacter salicylatoxidans TaxID=93369 RepID=A0A316C0N2_PSESE|nr:hypothetical protein [Pseudaminobacter salicylatoxidans]PWJ81573.1 hypothetical protein C7441_110105 [Pseudaminobacter salicylatoxidans]